LIINEAAYAIDIHRETWRRDKIALYWEGKNGESKKFTFYELSELSNKFANVFKNRGVKEPTPKGVGFPSVE
jgi:acetyl-CoA synthetase